MNYIFPFAYFNICYYICSVKRVKRIRFSQRVENKKS